MTTFVTEVQLAQAMAEVHLVETRMMAARIERLNAVLREHGLAPPEEDPRLGASDGEHLAACRRVVHAAYELLGQMDEFEAALTELRRLVGSGMELVGGKSWRP